MIKNTLITFFLLVFLSTNSYSAGTSSSSDSNSTDYSKAVKFVKAAKKFESDGKAEKANNQHKSQLTLVFKMRKKRTPMHEYVCKHS